MLSRSSSVDSWRRLKQLRAPSCASIPSCHRCLIYALADRAPLEQDFDLSSLASLGAQHRVAHTQQHPPLVHGHAKISPTTPQPTPRHPTPHPAAAGRRSFATRSSLLLAPTALTNLWMPWMGTSGARVTPPHPLRKRQRTSLEAGLHLQRKGVSRPSQASSWLGARGRGGGR